MAELLKCPFCGSKHIEEHCYHVEDYVWWLCRDCGKQWDIDEDNCGADMRGDTDG